MSKMAVDLTTGTYNEEGIFCLHNDESGVSDQFAKENQCSLKNFRTGRILKECLSEKSLVLEGHFLGDDKPAIVKIEKMPFSTRDVSRFFNADCRLELKFRNNIYSNYHVYPPSGFNGYDVTVIYPASEKDFLEFVDEPLQMVNESGELHNTIVLPHFKAIAPELWYHDHNSNVKVICKEEHPRTGFILMEDKPKNCACSVKHIRSVCVLQCKDILSLRDLTSDNIPLLTNIKQKCLEELSNKYNIPASKLLTYVCYPPSHFPFHVFFESVEKDHPIPAETAHHLETVIFNLQMIPDYYKKVTLTYSLSEKDDLLKKIKGASSATNCNQ